jgi:hypothetical protein
VVVHVVGVESGGEGGTAITAGFSPLVGFEAGVLAAAPPVPGLGATPELTVPLPELAGPLPDLMVPPDPVEASPEQVTDTLGWQVNLPSPQSASTWQGSCHLKAQYELVVVVHTGGAGSGAGGHTWLGGQAGWDGPLPEHAVPVSAKHTMPEPQSASTLQAMGWQTSSVVVVVVVVVGGVVLVLELAPEPPPEPPEQSGWSFGHTGGLASTTPTARPDVPDDTVVIVSSWQLQPFGQSAVVLHCCAALTPCSASMHAADVRPRRIVLRVVIEAPRCE